MSSTPAKRRSVPLPGRQRGLALLMLLMLVMIGVAFLLMNSAGHIDLRAAREKSNMELLTKVKDALIGWSLSRPTPGELPCPDTANTGLAPATCNSAASRIGRLPWKTLGIEQPADAGGETLWYALDSAFRPGGSGTASLTVYGPDGISLLTPAGSEAAAVVFSPGAIASATQSRTGAAQQNAVGNYLDNAGPPAIAVSRNNANAAGPFIQGPVKNAVGDEIINDRLVFIPATELLNLVSKL